MSKAQWKQPALKQAEKKVADREQAVQEAKFWKEQAEAFRQNANEVRVRYEKAKALADILSAKAEGYDFLRREGVVLMGDEPKHLQGDDMDAYVNKFSWNQIGHKYSDALGNQLGHTKNAVLRQMLNNEFVTYKTTGRYNLGSNTGSESKEADQKDSGHYTDILRYADWYRLRK